MNNGDEMNKKLNIGLVIDDLNNHFTNEACRGAEIAAHAIGANLFIIPGHYLGETDSSYMSNEYEYQYNTMFNLISESMVDIIYVLMGTIGSRASMEIQQEFLRRLPNITTVMLFTRHEGYHSVTFDNYSGVEKLMKHFFEHGYKKIGCVTGPLTNRDACERLDAYKSMMAGNGLPVEDKMVVEGDFTDRSQAVVNKLLDDNPDLEAIVFGNDRMAQGAYEVFKSRGLVSGKDIFVAGFDDDHFAKSLEPPLTTIKADSAELVYKAVLNAYDFIEQKVAEDISVETMLVQRSSCGCDGIDVVELSEKLYLKSIMKGSKECVSACEKYLFGIFTNKGDVGPIKKGFMNFISSYVDYLLSNLDEDKRVETTVAFRALVKRNVFLFSNYEKVINVLSALQYVGLCEYPEEASKAKINNLFSEFFRILSIEGLAIRDSVSSNLDSMFRLVNIQTGELYIQSDEDEIHYENLIRGFNSIGFYAAYVYLFQGNTRNTAGADWRAPNTCLLKTFMNTNGETITLPEEQQLIRTEKIFSNEFTETDCPRTMTVFPLFVGEDLYGLFVADLDTQNLLNVTPIAYQFSITIKSLLTIEEQKRTKKKLQTSLEQFMRDNNLLNKAARTDELTGLFNRRGFLEFTSKQIADPINNDRQAIILYADMDNLKMVNDNFGHDEGDFALKTISTSLSETFRNTDIVGRIGGDEFVAFAIVDEGCEADKIKKRLQDTLKNYSDNSGKPYPIEMSIGITEFKCSFTSDVYELLDEADTKLYEEKRARKTGRDSVR